ncbi:MAG: PKD domain-containing protein [Candidatus Peregrinibacteria bacterium]
MLKNAPNWVIAVAVTLSFCHGALAEEELGVTSQQLDEFEDIAISAESTDENILLGQIIRIYATVHNHSEEDQKGIVRFYNERSGYYIGTDQPFSAVAGQTDTVFIDVLASELGDNDIAIRAIPDKDENDNPENNKVTETIYVDQDADSDGSSNRRDPDDDNDGAPDTEDGFPFNPTETTDTDRDGIGNNEDTDDDGDGVADIEDEFPLDGTEWADSDGDGSGNNSDRFPNDPTESQDSDNDGLGANTDPNDTNHGPIPQIYVGTGGGGGQYITPSATGQPGANQNNSSGDNSGSGKNQGGNNGGAIETRVGKTVTFNALKSHDPDGEIITVEWYFGDDVARADFVTDHVFNKAGEYLVKLKVIDDKGEAREQIVKVIVRQAWPIVILEVIAVVIFILLVRWAIGRHQLKLISKDRKSKKGLSKGGK